MTYEGKERRIEVRSKGMADREVVATNIAIQTIIHYHSQQTGGRRIPLEPAAVKMEEKINLALRHFAIRILTGEFIISDFE